MINKLKSLNYKSILIIGVVALSIISNIFNIFMGEDFAAKAYSRVRLKSCYDGDTCRFYINGKDTSVRFSGIDAPELTQPYGRQSREALKKLLYGKNIVLKCNGSSYTRKVCSVYTETTPGGSQIDVQEVMVLNGYAWDATKYSKGKYTQAMSRAKKGKKGLWEQSNPQNPSEFRHKKNISTRSY
jgi:endonuclease YncB( thermonuclease family)